MKLSDVPKHIIELDPPYFGYEFKKAYGKYPGEEAPNYEDYETLFHISYYDGPRSGVIRFDNHYFYVSQIYYEDRCWWAAWEFLDSEKESCLANQALFAKYVGEHNSYTEDKCGVLHRDVSAQQPQEMHKFYYEDKNIPTTDYAAITSREIFGILRNPFWNRG